MSVCIGTVGIVKANFTVEEPRYTHTHTQVHLWSMIGRLFCFQSVQTKYNAYRKQNKKKHAGPMSPRPLEALANTCDQKKGKRKEKKKERTFLLFSKKKNKTYNTLVLAHTHSHTHDFPWSYTHLSRFPLIYKCSDRTTLFTNFSPFHFFFSSSTTDKKKKQTFNRPVVVFPTAETWSDFNQWAWFVFFWFFLYKVEYWTPPPAPPPSHPPSSHIKNISKECIYFRLSCS